MSKLFEKPERKPRGRAVLVLVLLLVNLAAIWGQAGSFLEHVVPAASQIDQDRASKGHKGLHRKGGERDRG
jgi:hypothetical protein